MSASVAVVILNFNGKAYLEKFLSSVLRSTYDNLQIIVADNGSSDGSLDWLKDNFPTISRIDLKENWGFTGGYNRALAQVHTDYFILLNSDVETTPGWIEPMVNLLEKDHNIAVVQPKILSYADRRKFEYAGASGGWIDFLGYPFARGRVFETVENDTGQYDDAVPIFWATGAALCIRKSVWHTLNGLDEYLFAHQEEIDLCWRTHRLGYKVYVEPRSVVYHVGGGTLPQGNPRKTYLNFRNSLIILFKNEWGFPCAMKILGRLVLDGVFAVRQLLSGDVKTVQAILMAHIGFYKWRIQKYRSKDDQLPRSKTRDFDGVMNQSVVRGYFLSGKKTFSDFFAKKNGK